MIIRYSVIVTLLALFFSIAALAQDITVRGSIFDTKGVPLQNVSIKLLNSVKSTVSDSTGKFSILAPKDGILEFSSLDYKKTEVKIQGKSLLHVIMESSQVVMDEVVVVGYGTQKKENLTGAVTQIKGEDIVNKVAPNAMSALQGEMPGVVVTHTSGQPGESGVKLDIRGHSSVNSIAPLVLVDGIEGDLQTINPSDIESISILKDASSASIFGSRAAGGVVLVKTKTGANAKGDVDIDYNGQFVRTTQGRRPGRLNSWEEEKINSYSLDNNLSGQNINFFKNPNLNSLINNEMEMAYYDNTNWLDVGLKDYSHQQRHNLSVKGGTRPLNYLVSAGYHNDQGFMKYGPDKSDVYSVRFNLNTQVNRYISMFLSASNFYTDRVENAYGNKYLMTLMYRNRTRGSVFYPTDEDPLPSLNEYAGASSANIVDLQKNGGVLQRLYNDFTAQAKATITNFKTVKNLRFDLTASRRTRSNIMDNHINQIIWYNRNGSPQRISRDLPSTLNKVREINQADRMIATGDYRYSFKNNHNFSLLGGLEYFNDRIDQTVAEKSYVSSNISSLNHGEAGTAIARDNIFTEKTFSSFGRFNYNYREKYLLEANLRHDGSSRLAPGFRWRTYTSFSGGWVISKESFFRNNLRNINHLKLRGSFGQLGNSVMLGYYDYETLVSVGRTIFGGNPVNTYYIGRLPSRNITWENVEMANVGIDINMFSNKLEFVGDIYQKRNLNMLAAEVSVPSLIGVDVSSINAGELLVKGWEFQVKWRSNINNFKYAVAFNLSDSKNTLSKYNNANVISEGITRLLEDYPLNAVWGYKTNGLFQEVPTQEDKDSQIGGAALSAGDVRYVNLDSDPRINGGLYTKENHGDLVYFGTTDPRYTYGFNLSGDYKRFGINVFLQGVGKRLFMIDEQTLNSTGYSLYQAMDFHRDYWTEDNPNALFPRPRFQAGGYNYRAADRWIQNGAYLRIKEVRIVYKVPYLRKMLKQCDVYLSGQNLYEFTKVWKAFDPEAPSLTGSNWYAYNRSITLGLNVRF